MKLLLIALFIIAIGGANAQNLVLNPSFENYDSLPCNYIDTASQFVNMMQNWTIPNLTTPDICSPLISSSCLYGNPLSLNSGGIQTPRTGNIMVGMVCENGGYNEYIQVPLSVPLTIGNAYQASMYVSLAAKSDFANNDIGMYFSDSLISDVNFQSTNYVPQILDTSIISDTLNWVQISGCFTATSSSRYLIIGNFISSCLHGLYCGGGWPMSYYFFDDISVVQISSCTSTPINCTVGINETESPKFNIYPNPVNDFITIENNLGDAHVLVQDVLGRNILTQIVKSGKSNLNMQGLSRGIYLVHYSFGSRQGVYKIIKE